MQEQINYFNYFTEIEEYFVQRRGRHLLVSPLDWCLIELWKESGVPLHVVLRGIDRSFEDAPVRRKQSPRTLFYCHPAVMEVFDEFQQARTGAHEEEPAAAPAESELERVTSFVAELRSALESRGGAPFERARELLRGLAAELQERPRVRLEELDRATSEIGAHLARDLLEAMPPERRKTVKAEVRKELRLYKRRLSPEMYQRLSQSYLERRVRKEENLPEFSLFDMQ